MKLQKIQVRMSELHSQTLTVGEWEIPVLAAVHGDADIRVVGEVEVDREMPDPASEYARLETRYGADREQGGLPYVAQCYGQHGAGVRALARAMEESQPAEQTVSLARLRKEELQKIAQDEFGIEPGDLNRDQLIEAIREAQDRAVA